MFESLERLPPDPILGVSAAFRADSNPDKIDVGVGVYKDEQGDTPVLQSVRKAEQRLFESERTKTYAPPCGEPSFLQGTKTYAPPCGEPSFLQGYEELVFGSEHAALQAGRVSSAQTPGGCGALRVAAEVVLRSNRQATVWVSDPTWNNHRPLLGNSGLAIREYPYYDAASQSIRFADMIDSLSAVGAGDLVLLHACCHNPTGVDLSREQWHTLADLALQNGFTPFIDMAYQGLADGLTEDAYGVRLFAEQLPELIVVGSCSKNFALYRERTGGLSLVARDAGQAQANASQIASVIRGLYSTPPTHGAGIVSTILNDAALAGLWQIELTEMRERLKAIRGLLVDALARQKVTRDFSFIENQRGMFSFLGISAQQVRRLRDEHSIYMLESGRISIAGINHNNVERLAQGIAAVL